MSSTAGIVGLSNAGKSTLFNTITKAGAKMASYPFAITEPSVGVVEVPDNRLARTQELIPAKKIAHTTFELTDIAGLVEGVSKDEGLGNRFLENIRQTDVIVHVARVLDDDSVTPVTGKVDPEEDINTISPELAVTDLDTVNRRVGKVRKVAQQGDREAKVEMAVLNRLKPVLEEGKAAHPTDFNEDEQKIVKELFLLTFKPVIRIANIAESPVANPEGNKYYQIVKKHVENKDIEALGISTATEEEVASVDEDERKELLGVGGVEEPGLDRLIRATYHILGLRAFFTAGSPETRAWAFHEGMKAPQIAGVIHSDFERGLIRAEVVSFDDLDKLETMRKVKGIGKLRLEGEDYVVQDSDIIEFRSNV